MDYKNGKIYKITDIAYTKMYIGSTTQSLSKRFSKHKANYKNWLIDKCPKTMSFDIFDEFGIDNCKIELIEEFPCENKNELLKKEGEHIKNNDCVNKNIAGRTKKEWENDNKDKILEHKKEYYENNKDKFSEYYKKRYGLKKMDLIEYQKKRYRLKKIYIQEHQKIYRSSHKNEKANYDKLYRDKNKDIIYKKYNCICGGSYCLNSFSQHNKSKLHLNYKPICILKEDFDFIFEMDSLFKLPRTYINIIINND